MRITVTAQHLDGNAPEDFDNGAWCEALRAEYLQIVHHYLPDAYVTVKIDRQRHTSGASRAADVFAEDCDDLPHGLERAIKQASNALLDSRGEEFYNA